MEAYFKEVRKSKTNLLHGILHGEFDPGSGRTLAACLTHASRTDDHHWILRMTKVEVSGGRVSNAWVTCPLNWDNSWKRLLIPNETVRRHLLIGKDG